MPLNVAMVALLSVFAIIPTPKDTIDAEIHCVAFVIDQVADGELILSDPDCFGTEDQAARWATGPSRSSQEWFAAGSTFTLGRHFTDFNGSGSSIRIVGSSCTGGYWNTSSTWDNTISSSYNGCTRLTHWDEPAKAGISQSTYGSGTTDNLSLLDNRAESVSYHSS